MSLPELSIRRPVMAWMLMAAIILFGIISFHRLGISQLPDVDFPVVSISLNLPGAAPAVMESQVLDPIEDALMEIDGIRSVTSNAMQSSGTISVEFELNRNIDESMQEIQIKINQVRNILPVDLTPPTLRKSNPEDTPIMWLALTSTNPNTKPIDLMIYGRNFLFDQFATVEGVGNVVVSGYVDPALRVWTDLKKLDHYNLTSDDVLQSIRQEHIERPAGRIENTEREYNVRTIGEARTPEEFGNIAISNRIHQGPSSKVIKISDVAKVEEGVADVRNMARSNGKRTVGLGIVKQHGSNAIDVAEQVQAKVNSLQSILPPGYQFAVRADNTRFIKQSVHELLFILGLSALLTSLVCYLFLGSWTSTMNVLLAIPTSIIGAFTFFYFFHFTLNTFTLLGLSLAIGIVVDDAIMMLENIVRHRELGEGKKEAALKGANEITFAAMAATFAVVAIFLPVVFMKGVIGRYFLQYGVTVAVAVLLSLLEALTLTPMRCSRFLKVEENPKGLARFVDKIFLKLANGYRKFLSVLLKHRIKAIVVTLLFFTVSLRLSKLIPVEMMPAQDQGSMMIRFKLPVGTALAVTDQKMKVAEDFLLSQKEVSGIFAAIGGFRGDSVNQGLIFVMLTDRSKRKLSQGELIQNYRKEINLKLNGKNGGKSGKGGAVKGVEVVIQDMSLRGFTASRGFPVEFIIQGPNWEKLTNAAYDMIDDLKKSGKVTDVNTDIQPGMPEVQLVPNRKNLAKYAVSLSSVTNVIKAMIGGEILDKEIAYTKGRHRYEIELRLQGDQRDQPIELNQIKIRNNLGELIPLSKLVDQQINPSLMLISRLNRERAITIYANPASGVSQAQALDATEKFARAKLPPGYSLKMTGSSQSFKESFQSLIFAMILGILVSYMVLASQFDSFIHPVTVLMALPFSFSGALIGLYLFHQSINIYSFIGFILLMGIVKKNSILLVDFTNQVRRDENSDVVTALLKACPIRLRPILMTSVATIAGALPEALTLGPGAEVTKPMAVSIIGGVMASTVLTLFIVPIVYSLFAKFENKDRVTEELRMKEKIIGATL